MAALCTTTSPSPGVGSGARSTWRRWWPPGRRMTTWRMARRLRLTPDQFGQTVAERDQRQAAVRDAGGAQERPVAHEAARHVLHGEEVEFGVAGRADERRGRAGMVGGVAEIPLVDRQHALFEDVARELGEELVHARLVRAQLVGGDVPVEHRAAARLELDSPRGDGRL